jgi:hypothetical protein
MKKEAQGDKIYHSSLSEVPHDDRQNGSVRSSYLRYKGLQWWTGSANSQSILHRSAIPPRTKMKFFLAIALFAANALYSSQALDIVAEYPKLLALCKGAGDYAVSNLYFLAGVQNFTIP